MPIRSKFEIKSNNFHNQMKKIFHLNPPIDETIHQFPLFTGMVTIARYLEIYEIYKKTLGISGHIAEVGTFKGSSLLYFAKLCEIFEPHSYTEVHGFDWFQGMAPGHNDIGVKENSYTGDYERLLKLIELQELQHLAVVHRMDVTRELEPYLNDNQGLRFKLVFMDAGIYEVVHACLPLLWNRLNAGGVLLLDHFGDPRVPGEAIAVMEVLGDVRFQTFPWSRQPAAYVIKE